MRNCEDTRVKKDDNKVAKGIRGVSFFSKGGTYYGNL